jgi:hypothetical protein
VRQEGETTLAERDEIVQLVRAGILQVTGALPELPGAAQVAELPSAPAQADVVPAKPSRRRRPAARKPADETMPVEPSPVSLPEAVQREAPADAPESIPYPRTGVEVVESVERDGVIFHAMRDLRNLKVIHNVTRNSARRLWRYAISQVENQPCREADVSWGETGERGFWKSYKPRGGDIRFNLAYRHDGHLHVFYGVTDEGMDDPWRAVVPPAILAKATAGRMNGDESEAAVSSAAGVLPEA